LKLSGRTSTYFSPAYNFYSLVKAAGPGLYTLKAWVYSDDIDIPSATLLVRGDAANMASFMKLSAPNAFLSSKGFPVAQSTWVELSVDFTVTAADIAAASGTFNFCVDSIPADAETIYLDDITLSMGVAPTPIPGIPAYKLTMVSNYVSKPDNDTFLGLDQLKAEIMTGTSAKLNVKNIGTNPITVYLSIRNNDATWTHAIDGDKATIAPGNYATLAIAAIPANGVHPVLQIVQAAANDAFVIGNFKTQIDKFTLMSAGFDIIQVDGTSLFTGVSTTMDPSLVPTPTVAPSPTLAPTPTVAPTEVPTAAPTATVAPGGSNGSSLWIWIVVAVVVIGGGVTGYLLMTKKKKAEGSGE